MTIGTVNFTYRLDKDMEYTNDVLVSYCDTQILNLYRIKNDTLFQVGNESFLSDIFVSITDTILHLANNFKTMFKVYRDFKRSELTYYLESHVLRTKMILDVPFNQIASVQVPIPRGMTTGYLKACMVADVCLNTIDMPMRVKVAEVFVNRILKDIKQGKTQDISNDSATHIHAFIGKDLDKVFKEVNEVFVDKFIKEKAPLSTVYRSVEEIYEVNKKLDDMEAHLIGVSRIFHYLDSISDTVDKILSELDKSEVKNKFSPNDLIKLAHAIRAAAVLFERYGLVINDVNRLTHNQVEVLEAIRKYRKM